MDKQTIRVWKGDASWMCTFTDPEVRRLFGTDTLPSAFTTKAQAQVVIDAIARRNPDCEVRLIPSCLAAL